MFAILGRAAEVLYLGGKLHIVHVQDDGRHQITVLHCVCVSEWKERWGGGGSGGARETAWEDEDGQNTVPKWCSRSVTA